MPFSSSNAPEYVDDKLVIDTSEQSPPVSTRTLCDPPSVSFNTNYSLTLVDLSSDRFEGDFQPTPDNGHAREFETAFCRDFSCCGLRLVDMHDLLQHYEECHVRFEDDVDDMFDDSEFFDEDGSSDSDTACPSPFPTSSSSPSPLELAAGPRSGSGSGSTPYMSAFSSPSLTTATAAATQLSARANQNSFFSSPFADQTPRPSPFSLFHPSSSNDDLSLTSFNNSIHPSSLQAFSASFKAPSKRKVSPTDVYLEDEIEMETEESEFSEDCSAFSNTILRTRTLSTSSPSSTRTRTSLRLAKRQAIGRGRSSSSSLPRTQTQVTKIAGSFGEIENGENYSGLDQPSLDILDFNLNLFPNTTTAQGPGPFVVDIRHRDEVVSLLEDIGKASSSGDRPYRCTISGCDKAYKNPNGLKYHNQHGHSSRDDAPETKPYVCTFMDCGRRYKNLNGLKYHVEHCHPNLIGALRAHHSGLTSNSYLFGPYSSHAPTIEAALTAIESPMMQAATNALLIHTSTSSDKAKEKETTSSRPRTRSTTPSTAPGSGPGPEIAFQMLMDMHASSGSLAPSIPSGLPHGPAVEGGSVSTGLGGGLDSTPSPLRPHPDPRPSSSDSR
ncbi:Transcriptional regulator of ribosomal biogenesis protein [Podila minutissima]|nr:Transcriptional regulator of ribosomal biogenesis protein [Podila minutissima]